MKISLLAAVGAVCIFSASSLHAQSTTTRTTISKTRRPGTVPYTGAQAAPATDGVVPRAVRSGSPLQMINPFAPAAYGNGQDAVRREPTDPYARPQGIKLVTVEF